MKKQTTGNILIFGPHYFINALGHVGSKNGGTPGNPRSEYNRIKYLEEIAIFHVSPATSNLLHHQKDTEKSLFIYHIFSSVFCNDKITLSYFLFALPFT